MVGGCISALTLYKGKDSFTDNIRIFSTVNAFCKLAFQYKTLEWQLRNAHGEHAEELKSKAHERGACTVVNLCKKNGGAFIKLG